MTNRLVAAAGLLVGVLLQSCGGSSGSSGQQLPELTVLLRDIHTQGAIQDSSPQRMVRMGGLVFFVATTSAHGAELWRTDGTGSGTVLVTDILPGSIGSSPDSLTVMDGALYFSALGPDSGRELWKTDGTAAGTVLIKDIRPGCAGSSPRQLTAGAGTLYFAATDDDHGTELWKSDGTAAGTVLVSDIDPGELPSGGPLSSSPAELVLTGATLFFTGRTQTGGRELWKSDGTTEGTVLVADIRAGAGGSDPHDLVAFRGRIFFTADNGSSGSELWASDGTSTGTALVADIRAGSFGSDPRGMTVVGSQMFFSATSTAGNELWKTDGSGNGTVLVRDIVPGIGSSLPGGLAAVGGSLFFAATSTGIGRELWKSDGTASGTTLVKDINVSGLAADSSPAGLVAISGTELVFAADDGIHGSELWRSDGTAVGTTLLADIHPGTPGSSPSDVVWTGSALLFAARDGDNGRELFVAHGTSAGDAALVRNLNPEGGASSAPTQMIEFRGAVYFVANDGNGSNDHGLELWRSDGTAAGTALFLDIRPGPESSLPAGFTVVGNTMFFAAFTDGSGRELWKTNGTVAGTSLVKDIQPGVDGRGVPLSSSPAWLTAVGGTLFFTAADKDGGDELWRSNGTASGTVRVKDIVPGVGSSGPNELMSLGGMLYFTAVDNEHGAELWKTNGTEAGTVLVKDILPGVASSAPQNLAAVGTTLFLVANDGTTGRELWKSNGTANGTTLVKDIHSEMTGSSATDAFPMHLTAVGNTLFFSADDGHAGRELWRSDGSTVGTTLVKDIYPGALRNTPHGSLPSDLLAVGGALIFWANDGSSGPELWRSDGTGSGTVKLRDIFPGCLGSTPQGIRGFGNVAWFYAPTPANGFELWRSDGTREGTALAHEFNPGPANSIHGETSFAMLGQSLITGADDGVHGMELWRVRTGQ